MKLLKILVVFFGLALFVVSPAFASTGAIFTTDSGCTGVNINIFTGKENVYLDGGPHHDGSTGLPDGNYYVKVTVPNGTLLGTSIGSGTDKPVTVTNGNFAQCYQLSAILVKASDNTPGYDTTTNGGGEYKVWVSQDSDFSGGTNKTDNFKVKEAPEEEVGSISGVKWLDANADGVQDPGESLLPNWTINLLDNQDNVVATTQTDALGFYEFNNVAQGNYNVCEEIPDGWHPSFPTTSTPNCNHVVISPHFSTVNVDFGNYQDASLTVIKHVVNDNNGDKAAGNFTMNVDGTNVSDDSFPGAENPGTTVTLKPGEYSVDEGNHDGYEKTLGENCEGTATSGAILTCTITNNDVAPALHLRKVVHNNYGGDALETAWTLHADGTGSNDLSGTTPVDSNGSLKADTFALSESNGPDGYSASDWNCVGGDQNGNSITLGLGEEATCTITNSDIQPQLTVIKHVSNDHGGNASASAFTMDVTGTNVSDESFPGAEDPGTTVTLDAGSYTVDEGAHVGYDKSLSADCLGNIAVGDHKTCTITNSDIAPTLTVIKQVNNVHGGNDAASAFSLHVKNGGVDVDNSPASGSATGTLYTLDAGTYNVGEDAHTGYFLSGRTGDCDQLGDVTLNVGDEKTCTITNTDIAPTLTLIKNVINNNGGTASASAFGLTVGGVGVVSGDANAVLSNHAYALNEAGLPTYLFTNITGDVKCPAVLNGTVTLDEGESVTCTITNDDIPAHLIVIKHVINDDFGTSTASAFTMKINGVTTSGPNSFAGVESPGVDKTLTSVGAFNVTESGPAGYNASYNGCSGTIALGQTKTCTITNNDKEWRMTGGGSIFTSSQDHDTVLGITSNNVRITHGFELHCKNHGEKDNLEINWNDKSGKSHKFHLDTLTSAVCSNDGGNPAPPKATANGFNKFVGVGTGSYDGVAGATINFTLTDNGEPGRKDTAKYSITVGSSSMLDVLVAKHLDQGNHQMHSN